MHPGHESDSPFSFPNGMYVIWKLWNDYKIYFKWMQTLNKYWNLIIIRWFLTWICYIQPLIYFIQLFVYLFIKETKILRHLVEITLIRHNLMWVFRIQLFIYYKSAVCLRFQLFIYFWSAVYLLFVSCLFTYTQQWWNMLLNRRMILGKCLMKKLKCSTACMTHACG